MTQGSDFDPKALVPGTMMRHASGGTVVLARRMSDGSGWWNTDGSGLADRVAIDGSWTVAGTMPRAGIRPYTIYAQVECWCGKTIRSTDVMVAVGAWEDHNRRTHPEREVESASGAVSDTDVSSPLADRTTDRIVAKTAGA